MDLTRVQCLCRGTLPPWSMFAKLGRLDLSANRIEGSLPPDYADLKQLRMLLLSANQLNGCAQSMAARAAWLCMHCLGHLIAELQ